jgi:hypothetical protein
VDLLPSEDIHIDSVLVLHFLKAALLSMIAWAGSASAPRARRTHAPASPAPSAEAAPSPWLTVLTIHLSARDLPQRGAGAPSGCLCVFFIWGDGRWAEWARTEIAWNNPNPQWTSTFAVAYIFQTQQRMRFRVADCDSRAAAHGVVGEIETDVQAIVTNRGRELQFELGRGVLCLAAEQAAASGQYLAGRVSAIDLKKLHTFSKNSPFIQFEKPLDSGGRVPVYRSEVIRKCYGCTWRPFEISLAALCNGDLELPLQIGVYNHNDRKTPEPIGQITASVTTLMESVGQSLTIDLPGKKRRPNGIVKFIELTSIHRPTLYDYLKGGLQLNLVTAIDFTGSSKSPGHHLTQGKLNEFEACIVAICSIICPYCSDQLFPVFGFGANVDRKLNHCFPLTFSSEKPSVNGLQGILEAYRQALARIEPSSPAYFAPITKAAIQSATASFEGGRTYTILLILAQGISYDMQDTIDAIVMGADAPLSILIVGIGKADFSSMENFDGDTIRRKNSRGVSYSRGIVQFAKFSGNSQRLAEEVLAEVPNQIYEFCSRNRIIPPH